MARIVWKDGKFISIETRKGLYVLAQMSNKINLFVYNNFRVDENWEEEDLSNLEVLCCVSVTRQFMQKSTITNCKIQKANLDEVPEFSIQPINNFMQKCFYKNTAIELDVSYMGENGFLIKNPSLSNEITKVGDLKYCDIDKYELANVRIYAEFNERLYLCYKLGRNVDPLRDLIFNQEIPVEYEVYLKIISGKITEEEWLALPI